MSDYALCLLLFRSLDSRWFGGSEPLRDVCGAAQSKRTNKSGRGVTTRFVIKFGC